MRKGMSLTEPPGLGMDAKAIPFLFYLEVLSKELKSEWEAGAACLLRPLS